MRNSLVVISRMASFRWFKIKPKKFLMARVDSRKLQVIAEKGGIKPIIKFNSFTNSETEIS